MNLPNVLNRLLAAKEISQNGLAKLIGVSNSAVSLIMKGQRCSPEVLQAILVQLSTGQDDYREILVAHIQDECSRANADYSVLYREFSVNNPRIARFISRGHDHVNRMLNLSEETERDQNFEDMLFYFAELVEKAKAKDQPDWNIDDAEKEALRYILEQAPNMPPSVAHQQIKGVAPKLLEQLDRTLINADDATIERTARAIWPDDAFVRLVQLAIQHARAPVEPPRRASRAPDEITPLSAWPKGVERPEEKLIRMRKKVEAEVEALKAAKAARNRAE